MLRAADVHRAIGANWPTVLEQLGIDAKHLRNRHGPCPACGGTDRFRFMNLDERRGVYIGAWYCNGCGGRDGNGGGGDAFHLLMRVHRWPFAEALKRVIAVAGLDARTSRPEPIRPRPSITASVRCDEPIPRSALKLLRESCRVEDCEPVVTYLERRACWPLPPGHALRAHPSAIYWLTDPPRQVGRFPALLAPLVDYFGELVALHVTYLEHDGRKLERSELDARKILGKYRDRRGCAVRLMPLDGTSLGIAEGIETALAAWKLHAVPTWAALNAGLLGRFEPPPSVQRVVAFTDNDATGYDAWDALRDHLDGRATTERKTPRDENDWNDVLQRLLK